MLRPETTALARKVYSSLDPEVSFHGQLGDDGEGSLFVYVINRIQRISYLDFVLAHGFRENSNENLNRGRLLMSDVARYESYSTPSPQRYLTVHAFEGYTFVSRKWKDMLWTLQYFTGMCGLAALILIPGESHVQSPHRIASKSQDFILVVQNLREHSSKSLIWQLYN